MKLSILEEEIVIFNQILHCEGWCVLRNYVT